MRLNAPATYTGVMATFLFKTEPGDYSWDDLVRDKRTEWDGITNPAALKHLRAARKGDEAFIYHTGDERRIVGLASIVKGPYPDPARPENTKAGDTKFPLVDIKALRAVQTPVTLGEIKADARFEGFVLLRESRLSVVPVPAEMDKAIRKMAGLS